MKYLELELQFDGPHAEADAQALAEHLAREFPSASTRFVRKENSTRADGTRDLPLIIPILALLVALPAAVKHSLDVNDRLELTKKCARLVAWAKERRARRQQNPFVVLPPHGVKTPLDQAQPEQLVNALAGPEEPPKP